MLRLLLTTGSGWKDPHRTPCAPTHRHTHYHLLSAERCGVESLGKQQSEGDSWDDGTCQFGFSLFTGHHVDVHLGIGRSGAAAAGERR